MGACQSGQSPESMPMRTLFGAARVATAARAVRVDTARARPMFAPAIDLLVCKFARAHSRTSGQHSRPAQCLGEAGGEPACHPMM